MNLRKLVSIGSIFGLSLLFGLALMVTAGKADAQQAPQAELQTSSISAIGSAFHYQGNLSDNGNPANGSYDFKFGLYDAVSDGKLVGEELDKASISVQNGLFNVELDFGATAFDGTARFLEVSVRSAAQGEHLALSPRQPILAVPYAYRAEQASGVSTRQEHTRVKINMYPLGEDSTQHAIGIEPWHNVYGPSPTMIGGDERVNSVGHKFYGTGSDIVAQFGIGIGKKVANYLDSRFFGNVFFEKDISIAEQIRFGSVHNRTKISMYPFGSELDNTQHGIGAEPWHNVYGPSANVPGGDDRTSSVGHKFYGTGSDVIAQLGVGRNSTVGNYLESRFFGNVVFEQDINATGADLAEPFAFHKNVIVEPGTVVTIDPNNIGKLRIADSAYDKTVAGIVSGANGISAGIVMQHDDLATDNDALVALSGRVYVKVDAQYGAIQPGDMLTTSDTPGHAMKASNHELAQGAIIGKAMSSLDEGTGMVLVLVSLQ